MTTLQKITALNWFDFLRKIKEILLGISAEKIEEAPIDGSQYARQDGEWSEVTGGGGGSQDLQSVLDVNPISLNKSAQFKDDPFTRVTEIGYDGIICVEPSTGTRTTIQQGLVSCNTGYGPQEIAFRMFYSNLIFYKNSHNIGIYAVEDETMLTSDIRLLLPYTKSTGTYTLATTTDIYPVYANDAAADADVNLLSGNLYKITGSRVVYQKP